MKHIISFSGGKDSTAMLLRMHELKMPIDEIIFFDTGWEFPEIKKHIDKVGKYIGRKITKLKSKKSFDYWMYKHKRKGYIGKGFPTPLIRWCTGEKRDTIRKYQNKLKPFIDYIGFAFDEQHRQKPLNFRNKVEKYPLIKWGWTEKKCLEYCYSKGFDFGGLYKYFSRVSCWCCPLQSKKDLRILRKHFPKLWKKLLEMQKKSWNSFRNKKTVFDLEEEFIDEERQINLL